MIRTATIKDVGSIQALLQSTWQDTYGNHLSQTTLNQVYKNWQSTSFLSKQILDQAVHFAVANIDHQIVGVSTARQREGVITLYRLYVLPTHQRKGIGKMLLDEVLHHFSNSRTIQLHVELFNTKGQEFYKKHGFKEVWRGQELVGGEILEQVKMELTGSLLNLNKSTNPPPTTVICGATSGLLNSD